jgi:hypothetical protein
MALSTVGEESPGEFNRQSQTSADYTSGGSGAE